MEEQVWTFDAVRQEVGRDHDLGVQLDRPNLLVDPQEAAPTHQGNNLIEEIAELDQGDRISQLALAVEDPDSAMRVAAAYALGDLATRTQGVDRDQIIAILMRLSEDVDPQDVGDRT